ncbi:MAG: hypothetical protein H5T72_09705 [Actinobacteria bacterium]|nr:hypothetical protein [Actinomycetota bacterium]
MGVLPALVILVSLIPFSPGAGCSSRAGECARETRSSYINARAVLAEVKEFPSSMEELLRSRDPEDLPSRAGKLVEETRGLITEAASAFRAVQYKIGLLREQGGERYAPYAEAMESLVDLNLEVLALYGELVGLSASALEGLPYTDNPSHLMPTLRHMDEIAARLQETASAIASGEEEAEALFRALEE